MVDVAVVIPIAIFRLKRDENSIWERLTENDESKPYAVLFISLITANIRVLRSVPAKIVSCGRIR